MLNQSTITNKLDDIAIYLGRLHQLAAYTLEEYRNDFRIKHSAERLIELIVEEAVDVNELLILELGGVPADDYYTSFIRSGELGVLPPYAVSLLAPFTGLRNRLAHFGVHQSLLMHCAEAELLHSKNGLRNRLAHEYDSVRDEIVHENIPNILDLFPRYIATAREYLNSLPRSP